MKPTEVSEELIGKRCKSIFKGMMVTGTIEEITITKNSAGVKIRFDKPHSWWDGKLFESDWSFGRFADDFGSLQYLEIIDDKYQSIKVTFPEPIGQIDKMFVRDYKHWGAVNLKEWIDCYECSRFTQIDEHKAIITSEYNLENVKEWLAKNIPDATVETII